MAPVILLVATVWAYHNSLTVPFILDDQPYIPLNPRIRHLWPLTDALAPPPRSAAAGPARPLLNLSLALNYALGRLDPRGYHAVNLGLHLLAGLALFGLVRRTCLTARVRSRAGPLAAPFGLAVALLWLLHPLQTESVTYIIQRTEVMAGACYLFTLYALARSTASARPWRWHAAAVLSCAAGMASKPVMATAPLLAVLYDRTFLAESWRDVWHRRGGVHLALAATWVILLALVLTTPTSLQPTIGFSMKQVTALGYLLTQPGVVLHYLRLALWPSPLIFDYAWPVATTWRAVVPPLVILGTLLAGTVGLWRRQAAVGFLGLWTFLILAPSSSVIPIKDIAFEHRMYLPLAGAIALAVVGVEAALRRVVARPALRRAVLTGLLMAVAAGLGLGTIRRNADYRSEETLWRDTVAKRPRSPRAQINLGVILAGQGRWDEAKRHYEEALRLAPDHPHAHNNLGTIFTHERRWTDAIREYREARRLDPYFTAPCNNLGAALVELGQTQDAIAAYRTALTLDPGYEDAHFNLGNALTTTGRLDEAMAHYAQALRLKPEDARVHNNWGAVLARQGRLDDAITHFQAALRLDPSLVDARNNLSAALARTGHAQDAEAQLRESLRLDPSSAEAHYNLGLLLAHQHRLEEATQHLAESVRLTPDRAEVQATLALVLVQQERLDDAVAHYREAVRLRPADAQMRNDFGTVLGRQGTLQDAAQEFAEALRLQPDYAEAHSNLANTLLADGQLDDAIAHYREALRLKPDYAEARANLDAALARQRSPPHAP